MLETYEAPLQLREYPLPARIERGTMIVRTEMAGICGTDVHLWKGQLPIQLPIIMGHETVGSIEQLGEGVTHDWTGQPLKVGDRVTWNSAFSCGQCYYCAEKSSPRVAHNARRTGSAIVATSRPTCSAATRSFTTCTRAPRSSSWPTICPPSP